MEKGNCSKHSNLFLFYFSATRSRDGRQVWERRDRSALSDRISHTGSRGIDGESSRLLRVSYLRHDLP